MSRCLLDGVSAGMTIALSSARNKLVCLQRMTAAVDPKRDARAVSGVSE
jgi:hypothetical protein